MLKRIFIFFVLSVFLSLAFCIPSFAQDGSGYGTIPEDFYGVIGDLPDEVEDKLPNELYSNDPKEVGDGLARMVSVEYVFSFVSELILSEMDGALPLLGILCGLLLISALFNALRHTIASESLSSVFGFCSTCAIFASIASLMYSRLEMLKDFFERLNSLFLGFIPISCAVWAMGGNIGTASLAGGTMYGFLTFAESVCAKSVTPVTCLCIVFALCRGISPSINLGGFASAVKKCYTFVLGFIMTLLLAILSFQSMLGSSADSVAARGAKMVTSSIIPIVGGSVSDTLRTLGASVQYIKSVVGIGGIVFVAILLLPTLISLLLTRLVFLISGSVADLLGCEGESKLIGELGGACGCMIAAVSMSSVMFVLAFDIFIKSAVAVGG